MNYLLALMALLTLTGCEKAAVEPAIPITTVKTMVAGDNGTDAAFHFAAEARAADRTHLSFRVGGEVTKIYVVAGQMVEKGELIAELDPIELKIAKDDAQARFDVTDSQYRRSKPLVGKGYVPQSQFDEIKATRQIALAQLNLTKLRLTFTQLRAPFSGVISRVGVQEFESIQPGEWIVNLHRTSDVEIIVQVPDTLYASKVEAKSPKPIVILEDGSEYVSSVKEFTTEPDPELGSYVVTLTMPMPEGRFILDGMPVDVELEEEEYNDYQITDIVLPLNAIFNEDGDSLASNNSFVWVVDDNSQVVKRRVQLGALVSDGVRIIDGLQAGERVVVSGVSRLRDGWPVSAVIASKELQTNES
ncbi:efflux RND transporter periplasmic adaptor subunit [Thaumasiovibrio sp. DFM-14]|uniref:efflux RND transporter periplasmic adaptor subunit n=1 Tax=Thaumasiovibrio sp. DFM-14 TaxID=3384792 RepID=UPI0039A3C6EC